MKRSLIPDPVRGLLDIQVAGKKEPETSGYAIDEMEKMGIKTFYDPNFKEDPINKNKGEDILTIYNNARYGGRKIPELKKWCKDRGLKVSGTKKQLIDRLHEHTQKVKKERAEKELKIQHEERDVVNKHKNSALLKIKNNIERLSRMRLKQLDILVKAQQTFDKTEAELNEMKATLKSLEKVL